MFGGRGSIQPRSARLLAMAGDDSQRGGMPPRVLQIATHIQGPHARGEVAEANRIPAPALERAVVSRLNLSCAGR